jgi:hypothetical protein
MPVSCKCCVLSGRGLCVTLIIRPVKSYQLWCVLVWSWSVESEEALAPLRAVAPWGGGGNKRGHTSCAGLNESKSYDFNSEHSNISH